MTKRKNNRHVGGKIPTEFIKSRLFLIPGFGNKYAYASETNKVLYFKRLLNKTSYWATLHTNDDNKVMVALEYRDVSELGKKALEYNDEVFDFTYVW